MIVSLIPSQRIPMSLA